MPHPYPGTPIRPGSRDIDSVRLIQQRLVDLGIQYLERNRPLSVDGIFGPETETAVRLFQVRAPDLDGNPLDVDGIVGPQTWAALFGEAPSPVTEAQDDYLNRVLETARSQIGVVEEPLGSNRGKEVDQYLRSVGLNPERNSYAWCAAFVYWCFDEAAEAERQSNPGFRTPAPKTAGVHDMWQRAGSTKLLRITRSQTAQQPELVQPGHVFFIDTGGGFGHTGLVSEVKGTMLTTIEGNTTVVSGSREGVGVFQRNSRRIPQINLGFADFTRKITLV